MAADKAAPTAAEQQDAALRQLLASMRCKQYTKAREACTAALAAGAEPKLMKDYAAALDAVIAQRGGGADDVAAEAEDGSGRGRVVEQLAELLLTLNAGTADSVGSARRRQSVLPFEPFPYPKFDPAALAGNDESSEEDESESGGEASGA